MAVSWIVLPSSLEDEYPKRGVPLVNGLVQGGEVRGPLWLVGWDVVLVQVRFPCWRIL